MGGFLYQRQSPTCLDEFFAIWHKHLAVFLWILGFLPVFSLTSSSVRYPWLEQVSRQEILNANCDLLGLNDAKSFGPEFVDQLDHILVENNHKLIYCYVPKVACTNWKRIMYVLAGNSNETNLSQIPANLVHQNGSLTKINQLNFTVIRELLNINGNSSVNTSDNFNFNSSNIGNNEYIKFIVVRHPFERLLSAYRNKLEGNFPSAKYFQSRIGRYIIKHYRPDASNASLEQGHDVSFREFVQYLITEGLNVDNQFAINEHWRPIHQMCHPCIIDYTFIIKYEHLIDEAEMLLDLIDARHLEFPMTKVSQTNVWLKKYFQQLSIDEIQKLYELYKIDFMLFGYDLQNVLGFDIG